jgi:cell division protein FtsQ
MPIEIDDEDERSGVRSKPRRFGEEPARPWWRPATRFGRILLGTGVVMVVSVVAISVHVLKSYLEHDSRFRIAGTTNIQATGLAQVSREQMLPVFGEDIGRNIFFVPISERRKQLEQIPWIEHATVMRLLPDQIRISVTERKPIAFVRQGSQVALVDGNGVVLAEPPAMMAQHHYSFPVVTGIDSRDPIAARRARMEVYQRLISQLDSSGQHLSDQISEIDLADPEDARVLMPEQGTDIVAHFGEDHFLERYQRYKAHIAEWRQQYPKLAEVDLRYDQQVVLQMVGAVNAPPAKLTPLNDDGSTGELQKPDPGKPEKTAVEPRRVEPKHVEPKRVETRRVETKRVEARHVQAHKETKTHKPAARNTAKRKTAPKKHPEPKHTIKKTKPTPKPHSTMTTGL